MPISDLKKDCCSWLTSMQLVPFFCKDYEDKLIVLFTDKPLGDAEK